MKNSLKCVFPENVTTSVSYCGTRLSSKFSKIKDKKNVNEHQHDIVCYVKCPERQCSEDYTGETARRLSKRVLDHNGRDTKSYLLQHASEKCHIYPIGKGNRNNTFKQKVTESLLIKDVRPTLKITRSQCQQSYLTQI